ncbi:putative AMP deaminase [Platanthera zijinensis]|uniref:AMP deaminase n=1 Tax=Platanthera zijinensis TaxID=2320716 RepID=A0AAP0G3L9_9ASPA
MRLLATGVPPTPPEPSSRSGTGRSDRRRQVIGEPPESSATPSESAGGGSVAGIVAREVGWPGVTGSRAICHPALSLASSGGDRRRAAYGGMDAYALHMAIAALVGASVASFCSYYLHRQSLSQFLQFALDMELHRVEEESDYYSQIYQKKKQLRRARSHGRRRRSGAENTAAMTEAADRFVDERDRYEVTKEGDLSRIETSPGDGAS